MFSAIYIEKQVASYSRVREIIARVPDVPVIDCDRYGEVFNRSAQNFRMQKQSPALILARKHGNLVLPAPEGYGFNGMPSFYFSHMLNCVYDCRYCFLQGMYNSAHYVLFVNYEEFGDALVETLAASNGPAVFYSGYDCDSLALEPFSRFSDYYLPLFAQYPDATLEIRTKSTQIRSLLSREPLQNVVIAMSFTGQSASVQWEHKVPAIDKRIAALEKLQAAGWQIALRFEPLIKTSQWLQDYQQLFQQVFAALDSALIHSVSIGEFRMPVDYYKKVVRLYPDEALLAKDTKEQDGQIAFADMSDADDLQLLERSLLNYIEPAKYYRCAN